MRLCENTAKLFTLQRKLTRSVELLPTTPAPATAGSGTACPITVPMALR